jgi:cell division protein FtsL
MRPNYHDLEQIIKKDLILVSDSDLLEMLLMICVLMVCSDNVRQSVRHLNDSAVYRLEVELLPQSLSE